MAADGELAEARGDGRNSGVVTRAGFDALTERPVASGDADTRHCVGRQARDRRHGRGNPHPRAHDPILPQHLVPAGQNLL